MTMTTTTMRLEIRLLACERTGRLEVCEGKNKILLLELMKITCCVCATYSWLYVCLCVQVSVSLHECVRLFDYCIVKMLLIASVTFDWTKFYHLIMVNASLLLMLQLYCATHTL